MGDFKIALTPQDHITGIYYIKCVQNNFIYIGQTNSIYNRLTKHRADLGRGEHTNKHLQADYNCGFDFVSGVVQELDTKTTRNYKEVIEGLYIIEFIQSGCSLYNYNDMYGPEGPESLQKIKDHIINKMALGSGVRQYTYYMLNSEQTETN